MKIKVYLLLKIKFKKSWVYKELFEARNVKPSFSWGLIFGIIFTGMIKFYLEENYHLPLNINMPTMIL
ncbi:MAG: hypothetical protein CM1200mP13_10100 [Candidatus Pelagibacterales bacterium]|nr:MAG: hypothetical protein CM1200mP13_10100 [Pelagibacterales bacterium]